MGTINQHNGIHINVRASVGGARAGRAWIEVPAEGVPADLLPYVKQHLGPIDEHPNSGSYVVDAPTWEAVRAEVESNLAAEAQRKADRIAKAAADTADWRKRAAAYLAGGDDPNGSLRAYHYDATTEEQNAVRAEWNRRRQADAAAKTAQVEAVIGRLAFGEGTLDTPGVRYLEIDGKRISWSSDEISSDLQTRIDAIAKQRAENEKREKAEVAAKAIVERDTWIRSHGSARLQKGLATGMIDKMTSVYLDERISHDLGADWSSWQAAPESDAKARLNPEESELDALAEALAKWPDCDARLRSVGGSQDDDEGNEWRPALLMSCPWDKDDEAIKYLD